MKILWFTWKDLSHPLAGGAELLNESIAKKMVADGHEVTFIVGGYSNCERTSTTHGYTVIRLGNRWSVYYRAWRYYTKNLRGWADIVIDEVNTIPFFAQYYVQEKNILFIDQLCRQIWFYQMFFPLNIIGYVIEPLYLQLLKRKRVITISESSKQDLIRHGFSPDMIDIISVGIRTQPLEQIEGIQKFEHPTLLSLGAIRPMKRTADIIRAFELAKKSIPDLRLIVAGDASGTYGQRVLRMIKESRYASDIVYEGRVSEERKMEIMRRSHCICVTSTKEGWGLIVTEANSQGTPAIVYDVDGLRDSTQHGVTGLVSKNNPVSLSRTIEEFFTDPKRIETFRIRGWEWSKHITFDASYRDSMNAISKI